MIISYYDIIVDDQEDWFMFPHISFQDKHGRRRMLWFDNEVRHRDGSLREPLPSVLYTSYDGPVLYNGKLNIINARQTRRGICVTRGTRIERA